MQRCYLSRLLRLLLAVWIALPLFDADSYLYNQP
jgi:hypothetical protein